MIVSIIMILIGVIGGVKNNIKIDELGGEEICKIVRPGLLYLQNFYIASIWIGLITLIIYFLS